MLYKHRTENNKSIALQIILDILPVYSSDRVRINARKFEGDMS